MQLNLPSCELKIKDGEDNTSRKLIFDISRKQWVALTPEEYVRQMFMHYMINYLSMPVTHISVEQAFTFENGKPQRVDMVVYDRDTTPFILVECKAPTVKISQNTFDQASRYNTVIKAKYIIITNGLNHYCAKTEDFINYQIIKEMPSYPQR